MGAIALGAYGLSKRYPNKVQALRQVDIEIPEASVTALVGPNGAGKSTAIKVWVGFERPTGGRVSVLDVDPWQDRVAAVRQLGYVPQATALYRELTVQDHVRLAATLREGFDSAYATDRMKELDIPLRSRPRQLSGGQQAQVALGLALGTRARVLLLDEPLSDLDPLARRDFLAVVSDVNRREGVTVLLSSHVMTDVGRTCDRLLILDDGQVLLHESIPEALEGHHITVTPAGSEDVRGLTRVASFRGETGESVTLWRRDKDIGDSSGHQLPPAASLEEVVIGHLAAGRRRSSRSESSIS
jgi:ABC-2 type transport system ATP-binding protein